MYNLNSLSMVSDCDTFLTKIGNEKSDLQFRQESLIRQFTNFEETSQDYALELAEVESELASKEAFNLTLAEGNAKKELEVEIALLVYRKMNLTLKSTSKSKFAVLLRNLEVEKVVKAIAAVDELVALVESHKATLPAA
jgi:hypothetical protein